MMLEAKTVHVLPSIALLTLRSQVVLVQGLNGTTRTCPAPFIVVALMSANGALVSISTLTVSVAPFEPKQLSEMLALTLTLYDWPLPKQLS